MRLALILLTALLLPLPTPSPPPKSHAAASDTHKAEPDHRGTQDDPLVVHIKGTEQSQQEAAYNKNKDDREDKRKIYELLLTGVIAFAAIAQFGTAIVQACIYRSQSRIMLGSLHAIRRQVISMRQQTAILADSVAIAEKSSETTAESLKAMIDKERARLSIEIVRFNFGEIPSVSYKITCHGTTPAYLVSSWERTGLYPIPDFGWPEDDFGFTLDRLPSVIPVGIFENYALIMGVERESRPFARADWGTVENKISNGESYLHFRVRILYKDVFDDLRTHELQISKIYGVKMEKAPATILEVLSGKPAEMRLGNFPNWSDSIYKFGQT
jgi:hypothetical protein